MSMEKLHKDGNKKLSGERQKLIKLAFASAAANFSKPSGSSGNIRANNTNSNCATCTIVETSTKAVTDNVERGATPAAATTAPAATSGVTGASGRQLGGQTLEQTSNKSKEPLAVLKRLAEPQKFRAEVKRLKTENEESESKREEQTLVLAKLNQQLYHNEGEIDRLGESVEDLKKTLDEKEEEISALEDQSRQQESEQADLERQVEEAKNAKVAIEGDLHRQMDRCNDAELQRVDLEAELSDRKRKYDGLKKIIKQAVRDHQDFVLELKEKGKRLQGLETEVKRADEEKAAMYADLKRGQEECQRLQEARDRKDEFAESAKIAAARLLHIVNSIYDSMGDEGTEERDDILGDVRNDFGSY